MLAPGTSCCSSGGGAAPDPGELGASNSIGSPVPNAVVSRSGSDDSRFDGEASGAVTVPTCRSVGTSGWKSSAADDDAEPVTALAEALSDGPSVIPGPFSVPSPVGRSGCPRWMGPPPGYPARADEFLCSGYVTIPECNSSSPPSDWGATTRADLLEGGAGAPTGGTRAGAGGAALPRAGAGPIQPRNAASAATASGTCARSMTTATIGAMITASTNSRSNEPAPPPYAVSRCMPVSTSTRYATRPANSDAVAVTRMVRTSATPSR